MSKRHFQKVAKKFDKSYRHQTFEQQWILCIQYNILFDVTWIHAYVYTFGYARWFNTQGDFHMLRKCALDKGNLLIWMRISSHYTSCSHMVINHRGSTRRGWQHKWGKKKQTDISQAFIPVPSCIKGHFWHFVSSFFLVFISVIDGGHLRDPNIANCHSE